MSRVYGVRDRSLHNHGPTDPAFARNPHILAWWTEEHDRLLARLIERDRWLWYWSVADEVAAMTSRDKLARRSGADPKVFRPEDGPEDEEGGRKGTYASYNVVMYFARSRAEALGLTDAIRPAEWKTCPLCGHRFREDSLWVPPARVYGAHNITHCSPCLEEAVHGEGDGRASEEKILDYARQLAQALARPAGRRPTQRQGWPGSFGLVAQTGDLRTRVRYVEALHRKPALARVKDLFGSWRAACDAAMPGDPRPR